MIGAVGIRNLLLLLVLGLASLFCKADAAEPVLDASSIGQQPVSLTTYFAILDDTSARLALADVQRPEIAARFTSGQPAAEALGFAYTRSAIWLRLHLINRSDLPLERMLEVAHPLLAKVDFYRPAGSQGYQTIHTGYARPFMNRPHMSRFFVLPLHLPAGSEQIVYLRIETPNSLNVPAKLWELKAFQANERVDYVAQAAYFGLVLSILLYNFMLYLVLRDRNYLMYVIFATFAALTLASLTGVGAEFLWGDLSLLTKIGTNVFLAGATVTLILFMRRMIGTAQTSLRIDRLLLVIAAANAALFVLMIPWFEVFARTFVMGNVISFLILLAVGIYFAFKRNRSAYFFVLAFFAVLSATVFAQLRALGYLPTNVYTTSFTQWGSALEMLLLSFALADRFNAIRKETTIAQQASLEAERQLVENLKSSERMLEERVQVRTEELQNLNRKLETLSATDGLTGIANRRAFDETLASEWKRLARTGQPLAVALLDVDWFKKYNDHYGHLAGDECLRDVAGLLAQTICRAGDLVARYGGEEFVFIAQVGSSADALEIAEKFRESLHGLTLPHAMSTFGCVTVSIGIAVMVPGENGVPNDLVKSADEALYRAKEAGRNRSVLAESTMRV